MEASEGKKSAAHDKVEKMSDAGRLTPLARQAQKVLTEFYWHKKPGGEMLFSQSFDENHQKVYIKSKIKDVINKLTAFCKDSLEVPTVLNETSEILKEVTKSMGVSTYFVDDQGEYIVLNSKYMPKNGRHTIKYKIEPHTTVSAYVAYTREFIMVNDVLGDVRFPKGIPGKKKTIKAVLCFPVITADEGKCIAVIELYREFSQAPYNTMDLQVCLSMTGWMGAAVHQHSERLFLLKRNELSTYLLALVEFYFMNVLSYDKFVNDVIDCAKLTAQAERGSLFVLDEEVPEGYNDDLSGDIYVEGIDNNNQLYRKKNKQRFSRNLESLGFQAIRHNMLINVPEVYKDPRFNRAVDHHVFHTRSCISVPLKGGEGSLGVLQLANKLNESAFTEKDELLLTDIATYTYLASRHSYLKDEIRKNSFLHRGYKQMLIFHMSPCKGDVRRLKKKSFHSEEDVPKEFFDFEWAVYGEEELAPKYTCFMYFHLFGEDLLDYETVMDFTLRVKKSYRDNPYHNFIHAFTVTHTMFNILVRNKDKFTFLEMLCLMIATLCHDSDHGGFTNSFLQMTNHWVAEMYWESPLEHHHLMVCRLLIEGSGMLAFLSEADYTEGMGLLKKFILATDLPRFLKERPLICQLLKSKTFVWNHMEHRLMFMDVMMTMCDLSGQCKTFKAAKTILDSLCDEFYNQGDIEKSLGLVPLPFMDRDKEYALPEIQIQFINLFVISSLEILVNVLPNTGRLLSLCLATKRRWEYIRENQPDIWTLEEALPKDEV